MGDEQKEAIKIFYCYAHEDKELRDELEKHLSNLKQQSLISTFHDREITAGREWAQEIDQHLENANIILLLISSDFIASDYHYGREMKLALNRQKEEKARVLPIILRPVEYEEAPFSTLQLLPPNGKPVTTWKNQDEAFVSIVQSIKKVINELKTKNVFSFTDKQGNSHITLQERNVLDSSEADFEKSSEVDDSNPHSLSLQKTLLNPETVSPSTERFFYAFDQTYKAPKQTKKGKRKSNSLESMGYHQPTLSNIEGPAEPSLPKGQLDQFSEPPPPEQQHRIPNKTEPNYENLRNRAQRVLDNNQPQKALSLLEAIDIGSAPSQQRWRLATLRGHCYFGLGKFLPAQRDYTYALREKPERVPKEQLLEEAMLYLHLAESNRELGNLDDAYEQYHMALAHMNGTTQIRYLAEAHWGLALVLFEQISRGLNRHIDLDTRQKQLLQEALDHAKSARQLYHFAGEALNAASVTCDMALFEQITGNLEGARTLLKKELDIWTPMLHQTKGRTAESRKRLKEYNNIVSAAACYLAGIELEAHRYKEALFKVKQAQETAEQSNILRRAEAAMMLGRILEAQNLYDPATEEALYKAVEILAPTDLLAARIRAHDLLGRHLLKIGREAQGEEELDRARELTHQAMFSHHK